MRARMDERFRRYRDYISCLYTRVRRACGPIATGIRVDCLLEINGRNPEFKISHAATNKSTVVVSVGDNARGFWKPGQIIDSDESIATLRTSVSTRLHTPLKSR